MSKFKKKIGRRILAYMLSGAMIMSNMTAFASEAPEYVEEGNYEETADSNDIDRSEKDEENLRNEGNASGETEETEVSVENAQTEEASDEETPVAETTEAGASESAATEVEASDEENFETEATETEPTEEAASDEETSEAEASDEDNAAGETTTYTSVYDFTDGSIIPNDSSLNGTTPATSADGRLTVGLAEGCQNAYGHNGDAHGAVLKEKNTITIHVLGDAKVFIGGCQFSSADASLTVTSGDTEVKKFDKTQTTGCYHNDKTAGLSFDYTGDETDLVMTFSGTKTYVPIITVERTEPLITANVTLNGSDCLQAGDTIKLVNKDDATDAHDITAATSETSIELRVNATYNIISSNMEVKATSNGETTITTEKTDNISITIDLIKSTIKTITYEDIYDFRDGSIIPNDVAQNTPFENKTSADGKLSINNCKFNGTQHGIAFSSGNKITIQVLGDTKVFVGGSQYSGGKLTVTSDSGTVATFESTTTTNYSDKDETSGLSFTYKGGKTDLVLAFEGGATYVPIIKVERTEPLIPTKVTLNNENNLLKEGDVIKLVNTDDATDVHKFTTADEIEVFLRANATYDIKSNNIAIKATSNGKTSITTSIDDAEAGTSVSVDLEETGVKTITYKDEYSLTDGSIIPTDATAGIDSPKTSADGKLTVSSGRYENEHGSAFSSGNKITIHVLGGSAKVFLGGCVFSGKRAEGTNNASTLTVTDKSGETVFEVDDTYVSDCYNSEKTPTAGLSFTYKGEETDLTMTYGGSGSTYLPIITVERTEPAVPVKVTLKDDNNLLKTGDTIKLVNQDDETDVYDLTKVSELLLKSNTTITYDIVSSNNTIKATSDGKATITIDTSAEGELEAVVTLEEKTVKATVTLDAPADLLQAGDTIKLVNSADADDAHDITNATTETEITLRANSIYNIVSSSTIIKATFDGKTTVTTEEADIPVTVVLEERTEPVVTAKITLTNAELLQSGDTIKLVNKADETDEYYISKASPEVVLKTEATYDIVCSNNNIKAVTSDGKTTVTTETTDIEVTIVLEEKSVKAKVTLTNTQILQSGDTVKLVNKEDEEDLHDITGASDETEIVLKANAVYNIVCSNNNVKAAASDGAVTITTQEADIEVTIALAEKTIKAKVTLKDTNSLLKEGDTVKLVNANDESDAYDITTATTETEITLKANATYNIVSSNADIIAAASDGTAVITTEEADLFVTITLKTEGGEGEKPGPVTYPATYNFADGSIVPADTSLNGTATLKSADGQLTVECGPKNGYGYNGADHGSIFKEGNKITIHVPGSVKVLVGGCEYSGGSLTVTSGETTIQKFETTKTAACYHNDSTAGLSFEYIGEETDLVLTFGAGSTYVPAIVVDKVSAPVTYPATYNFADGSIVPADTSLNGTATVKSADGQLTVECGPKNGYGYNGADHGSIFKEGNKITIHVPGSVKVLVGGCEYSGGSLTVTSGETTIQKFETTKTAACYHNDATAGLSFEYKGEETDLVLTFGAGSTYVPAIIVDKLTGGGSEEENPDDNEPEEEDTKITADNKKDTVIPINSNKIQVKAANFVESKKPQYAVTVTYTYKDEVTGRTYQQQLTEGEHYTVALVKDGETEYDGIKVGEQKLTISGTEQKTDLGTFTGKKTVSYYIEGKKTTTRKNIAKEKLSLNKKDIKEKTTYTGTYITPGVDGLEKLTADDYVLVYKNNVNAGKASVTIMGQGNYYGSKVLTFNIKKADISKVNPVVTPTASNVDFVKNARTKAYDATAKEDKKDALEYKGKAITFKGLALTYGNVKLNSRIDYTIDYRKNTQAGKATATIKGANNYSGSIKINYEITANAGITDAALAQFDEQHPLDAEFSSKGAILTTMTVDGIVLKENTDYKVKYTKETKAIKQVKDAPVLKVTVTGAGSYKGKFKDATVYIKVVPGTYHIKDGAIVDRAKIVDKAKNIDKKKLINTAKITDASGTKIKPEQVNLDLEQDVTNTSIKVTPVDADNYKATTLTNCHVATKLKSIKQSKTSIEKIFDGVNTVTLTEAEIANVLPGVEAGDIRILSYKNNNKIGSATVTIEGKPESAFYGSANVKFKIVAAKTTLGTGAEPAPDIIDTGKVLDVWDFAAGATALDESGVPTEYLSAYKYNNRLTEEIINSWYGDGVAAGSAGVEIGSFAVKDENGEVVFEFNGNGKVNNRIRTKNTKITRKDEKSLKDADGNGYLGYVYSNSSKEPNVYVGIKLDEGDVVTAVVSSNGGDSLIKFEPVDGSGTAQQYQYTGGDSSLAGVATFYAAQSGEHKIYSADEKLVVARVTVEKMDKVTVSGTVSAPESLKDYAVSFKCKETGAVKTAAVTDGKYAIELNEGYTYDVALTNANGYVITNDNTSMKLNVGEPEVTYDVTIASVDLVTVRGSVKGLAEVAGGNKKPIETMKLTFESDNIYVPEFTLSTETGEFTVVLEKGVEYKVAVDGVDDFTLITDKISASADGEQDIVFEAKPVYDITINPKGVSKEMLASTSISFLRVYVKDDVKQYEEDYVYTFTGTDGIKLRDGQYEIRVGADCPYAMKTTSDLKVDGQNVEKDINFDATPKTSWDFRESDYTGQASFGGLTITGGQKHGTQYGMSIRNGSVEVPVSGACTIIVSVGYNWDIGMEGSETTYTDKTNSGDKDVTFEYTGEAGTAVITAGNTFTSYIKKIEVKVEGAKAEYKEKITVGAAGCDYTTINDALDAVKAMERTDSQRVTIEIQPGDYEEMLVIDTPNVTLKNANAAPSIVPINKGVDIADSSVRITSYYGHGYAYYSMGADCKWNADILAANKENGCMSFANPGTGTTSGSYWNATVVVDADGFEADGIIFENSFNQYVSKKAADDVIVPLSGAKGESVAARNSLPAGDTKVQYKDYVERAAALAITDKRKMINFNNCSFIGRQDTLYGGANVTAAFYDCDIYGGTDYIFGGMTAVFAKCDLVFNTNDQTDSGKKNDVGYITASQTKSGRGYLMYNCKVTSTTPGVNTASEKASKPGYLGRPWEANTGEALFYKTIIGKTDYSGTDESLIVPVGWDAGLGGKSALSQEYGSVELAAGVDNSAKRVDWSKVLTADAEGNVTLADGSTKVTDDTVVAAFLGEWNAFEGKDMTISNGQ